MIAFKERLQALAPENQELAAFLKELCARSFKNGELPQRCSFQNVSPNIVSDLRVLFGARAVKARDDRLVLDLKAAGLISPEARQQLLSVLAEALEIKPQNRRLERQQTHAALTQQLHAFSTTLRNSLAQKVHQRLADDLAQQRGFLWREGILQKRGATALAQIEYVLKALEILGLNKRPWNFSELGSRVTGSSKSFRVGSELYRLAADWVAPFLDEAEMLAQIDDLASRRARVWEILGVEQNGAAITAMLGGPFVYHKQGRVFNAIQQHFDLGEPSTLSLAQLAGIESLEPLFDTILTIENLTPFVETIQPPPLANALFVYTEGFPNRAVRRLLQLCCENLAGLKFLHWGDTDLAGVRILRNLAAIIGAPPAAFRCGPEDIAKHRERLIPLTPEQRENILRDLEARPHAAGHEILEAVLQYDGWLEQEAWEK